MQPLKLERMGGFGCNIVARWSRSQPFIENALGVLIHRPASVAVRYNAIGGTYLSANHLCGAMVCGGSDKLTFLAAPPEGMLVCQRCEEKAKELGLPSSSDLAGRHVCVGKVRAHNTCHLHGDGSVWNNAGELCRDRAQGREVAR